MSSLNNSNRVGYSPTRSASRADPLTTTNLNPATAMKKITTLLLAAFVLSFTGGLHAEVENLNKKDKIKINQPARAKLNASDLKVKPADKLNSKEPARAKLNASDLKVKPADKLNSKEPAAAAAQLSEEDAKKLKDALKTKKPKGINEN